MMTPFVVFALPRSRTAWLSVLLGSPDAPVGHDIGPTVDSIADFDRALSGLAGTCETGAAFAGGLIRQRHPDAPFVVIQRDPQEVIDSLTLFGLTGLESEIQQRVGDLAKLSAMPGTLTLRFEDLTSPDACARLYGHCLGRPMPMDWWAHLDPINVQVDMRRQLQLLASRRAQIEALKAEARELMAHG